MYSIFIMIGEWFGRDSWENFVKNEIYIFFGMVKFKFFIILDFLMVDIVRVYKEDDGFLFLVLFEFLK